MPEDSEFSGWVSEIEPGLFIATAGTAKQVKYLRKYGITSIVSLEGQVPLIEEGDDYEILPYPEWELPEYRELVPGGRHLYVHVSRYFYMDVLPILSGVCGFIDKQLGCQRDSHSDFIDENLGRQCGSHSEHLSDAPDDEEHGELDDDQVSVASDDSDASTVVDAFEAFCIRHKEVEYGYKRNPGKEKKKEEEKKEEEEAQDPAHTDDSDGAAKDGLGAREPRVAVHCRFGIYRSPTIVMGYLMRKYRKPFDQVLALAKERRSQIYVRPYLSLEYIDQLQVWEQCEYQIWEDVKNKIPKKPYQDYLDQRAWRIARRKAADTRERERGDRREAKKQAERAALGLSPARPISWQTLSEQPIVDWKNDGCACAHLVLDN
ncbi:protein-tyrosine phosphatase-like protein [Cercophora scortea]|uniref:protein-tyrosine-phosphatase n=1 Tax=Cercophora scortea TaxID=314031 RepID=A0AAE0IFA7_9PEZI|nr:protein-tyrosine phosphatase-like protein [Cercophora scortea]